MQTLSEEKLKQAKDIVRKVKIPAQPAVVIEISKEMKQEQPDFKKIGGLVSQDAALSARVLNVINSPFFGLARKVGSIVQALTLMGLNNFFKVVLTTCLRDALGGAKESDKMFWDHSMRAAVAAESIARAARTSLLLDEISPDQAYMAGLFHDSGIPVLESRVSQYEPLVTMALSHKSRMPVAEDKLVGTDHCLIGHMMAKSWSIPDMVCKAILHHHAAAVEDDDTFPAKLVAVVQLADYIAYSCDYSLGATGNIIEGEWDVEEWCQFHAPFLDELDFSPTEVNELKSEIMERLLE